MLIEKGADIRVKGQKGRSLLMDAAFFDRLEVAGLLIAKGADVQEKDEGGATALRFALGGGHDSVARLLMQHGAKPGSKQEEMWAARLRTRKAINP
jgi:ankyrin repeat protein